MLGQGLIVDDIAARLLDSNLDEVVVRMQASIDDLAVKVTQSQFQLDDHGFAKREYWFRLQIERETRTVFDDRCSYVGGLLTGAEASIRRPIIPAHYHAVSVVMPDVYQLQIVKHKREIRPEATRAVAIVISPIVIHPGQRVGTPLVPRVKQ